MDVKISSRLLPALQVGEAWISVDHTSKSDRDGKPCWRYFIDIGLMEVKGEDLHGWGNAGEMLRSLCGFLVAFAEAHAYGDEEGQKLFPQELAHWAMENSDELSILSMEEEDAD